MPMDEYLAIDAVSSSALKAILVSPLECWVKHVNPKRTRERHTTKAMEMGIAYHKMILEGRSAFLEDYATEFEATPNMIFGYRELQQLCKDNELKATGTAFTLSERLYLSGAVEMRDLGVLLENEYKNQNINRNFLTIQQWNDIFFANDIIEQAGIAETLGSGKPEVSIIWHDDELNMLCKARPDCLIDGRSIVALKTCSNPMKKMFYDLVAQKIFAEKYHIEYAWYMRAMEKSGIKNADFSFLFVEQGPVPNVDFRRFGGSDDKDYLDGAYRDLDMAMNWYVQYYRKFGVDKPWQQEIKLKSFATSDFPFWCLGG